MRPAYETVIDDLLLLYRLREFQPVVIGTPPLGIELPTSDIDIACCTTDFGYFCDRLQAAFGELDRFECECIKVRSQPAVCAGFWFKGWELELFGQTIPVEEQWGVRHFYIERRLLELEPRLKDSISRLKKSGLKTEPAFARALMLDGDPYQAVSNLESMSDRELTDLAGRSLTRD